MIKINLITVGRLKEAYWRDACAEYLKRLSADCKCEVIELSESRLSDSPSDREIRKALSDEAAAMEPYLNIKGTYNIAMCIEGGQLTSMELSNKLDSIAVNGCSTVNFIIGSSFGIDEGIKQRAHLKLSMSKLTFPHQLARVMLLEQIYRAFQITRRTKYHK